MLEFIFTDLWHFFGTCILLALIGVLVCDVIKAIKGN